MTSDEERREAARKLWETGEELGSAALLWYHIAKALGVRTATDGKTACDMLADLIEPSCDRDALLALAEESDNQAEFVLSREWEPSHQIMAYALANECIANARRIRKACGVER